MDLTLHNADIPWNILIKFGQEIGNNFVKIIKAKVNSNPYHTAEMNLFRQVATGLRGELVILLYI